VGRKRTLDVSAELVIRGGGERIGRGQATAIGQSEA